MLMSKYDKFSILIFSNQVGKIKHKFGVKILSFNLNLKLIEWSLMTLAAVSETP